MSNDNPGRPDKTVNCTVDGQPLAFDNPNQTAAAVLTAAGLDPSRYDLGSYKHNGDTKTYNDDANVHIKNGDTFVSVLTNPQVA